MKLLQHRRMKIVLLLILWFHGKSAVESQVLQAANVKLALPVPVPVPCSEEEYDDYSEDSYSDEQSAPNPNRIIINNRAIDFIRKKRQLQKEMVTSSNRDYYSSVDSCERESDNSYLSPDPDPQKGENWCEAERENGQNQRTKRQAQPDFKVQFFSSEESKYEDDNEDDNDESDDESDCNSLIPSKKVATMGFKTEFCVGLNNHRFRRFEHDSRCVDSDELAKNLFYRTFGVAKRKKRQIEPVSDSEYCGDDESENDSGSDNEDDTSKNDDYNEEYSEVRPDESVANENALQNVGFMRQYEY